MAVETAGDMISANPDLDIIYAANDGGTVGSVMAEENAARLARSSSSVPTVPSRSMTC